MEIFAHRGDASNAPENTLEAFRKAMVAGAEGLELDVQLTQDQQVIVVHDEWLGRTIPGRGRVADHTLKDLQEMDAGGWFGDAFRGESAPSLSDVFDLCQGKPVKINVELKTGRYDYPGLVERVAAIISESGWTEKVVISSFNHASLRQMKQVAPDIACAALVNNRMLEPWSYVSSHGFQAVHVERHACDAEVVRECHQRGIAVRAWTVNDEKAARKLFEAGVDGIITDKPAEMRQWHQQWEAAQHG